MVEIRREAPRIDDFFLEEINHLLPQLNPSAKTEPMTARTLKLCFSNPNFLLFIADDWAVKRIAGIGSIFFQRNIGREIAEIHDVVVDQSYRGQGTGEKIVRALVEDAKTFCKDMGIPKLKLYLTSRPERTGANKLYQKLGFVLVAKAEGEWGTNLYKIIIAP
ncbi:MAG: GNAT family N-acetyltransferase [Patescibacteria group bacterium]